ATYATVLYITRRNKQALEVLTKLVELEPQFHVSHGILGWVYAALGRLDEAIASIELALSHAKSPRWISALGHLYGRVGKKEKAVRCLKELEELSEDVYVSPWDLAMVYSGLGDLERWQNALTAALRERDSHLIYLGIWPFFDDHR